jgi:hypothetical protein
VPALEHLNLTGGKHKTELAGHTLVFDHKSQKAFSTAWKFYISLVDSQCHSSRPLCRISFLPVPTPSLSVDDLTFYSLRKQKQAEDSFLSYLQMSHLPRLQSALPVDSTLLPAKADSIHIHPELPT